MTATHCLTKLKLESCNPRSSFEPDEEMSELITKLWEMDVNCCEPGVHYEIDLQGYVTSTRNTSRDRADQHLFSWFEYEKIFEMPTYKAFKALLDNYESDVEKPEKLTENEEKENWHFLDVIMETAVMQEAHQYLVTVERAPEDIEEFKELLYKIWFRIYRRTREDDNRNSSGFEHVFVGETRDRSIIGFHNWIQFYLQEKAGNIDYRGFFRRGTSNEDQPRVVTLQFMWKEETKPIGSSFIGTSPEFEMALYTICHLTNRDRNSKVAIRVAGYEVEIVCHAHGMGIGSAYPLSNMWFD